MSNYQLLFTKQSIPLLLKLLHFTLTIVYSFYCPQVALATLLPLSTQPLPIILHIFLHCSTLTPSCVIGLFLIPLQIYGKSITTPPMTHLLLLLPLSIVTPFIPIPFTSGLLPIIISFILSFFVHFPVSSHPEFSHVTIAFTTIVYSLFHSTSLLPLIPLLILWYVTLPSTSDQLLSIGGSMGMMRISIPFRVLVARGLQETLSHTKSRKLFYFFVLNFVFMFIEVAYGWWSHSLGLISDGFHMLFDCIALAMGLIATVIARWAPDRLFTYGYARTETLSGFVNALFLIYIAFFVFLESIHRLIHPTAIKSDSLMLISVLGLLVNIIGVLAFRDTDEEATEIFSFGEVQRKSKDNNMEGIFLHVLSDTLGSVGVILSSWLIKQFGWNIADPICSLCLAGMIFTSVIPLLKSSANLLLQATPPHIDGQQISLEIEKIEGVICVEKVHIWSFSESSEIATVVIEMKNGYDEQQIRQRIGNIIRNEGINDTTTEIHVSEDK